MSTVRECLMIFLAVCVLGLAAFSTVQTQRLQAAKAAQGTAEATAAGYKEYATQHRKVQTQKEKTNHEVREALERHPAWADDVVPDELADRLRNRNP